MSEAERRTADWRLAGGRTNNPFKLSAFEGSGNLVASRRGERCDRAARDHREALS